MRKPRSDPAAPWELAGSTAIAVGTTLAVLIVTPPWGWTPAWIVVLTSVVVGIGVPLAVLASWRGGRRARTLAIRRWVRTGEEPDVPIQQRLDAIRRLSESAFIGWAYLGITAMWGGLSIWNGPRNLVLTVVWAVATVLWLVRGLPHRRTIKRLLAETEAEADAQGIFPTVR